MGTDAVLSETLARAARAGLVVALLPPLRDLDRVEDLTAAPGRRRPGRLPGHPRSHDRAPGRERDGDAVRAAPTADPLGAAMVDFATGRRAPAWLRVAPARRLTHELAAYLAPVTIHERVLLYLSRGRCSTSAAGRPAMPGSYRPAV